MQDRHQVIIEAGLALLRDQGYAGFTQPRVAAKAGLRQSHLTYYFPTRADLLKAVARAAVERQLAAADRLLDNSSREAAAASIARLTSQPENTRVLLALVAAAEQEPAVRDLFRELAAGMTRHGQDMLDALQAKPVAEAAYLLYALSVGLAVVTMATGQPGGEARCSSALSTVLDLLSDGKTI